MRKIFSLLTLFVVGDVSSQALYETYVNTPSTATRRQIIQKEDLPIRYGRGATTIIPTFEGNRWDDNSKNAVLYAIQLLEEYLETAYPIKIKFIRDTGKNSNFINTSVRLMENDSEYDDSDFDGRYAQVPLEVSTVKYPTKVPSALLKRWAVLQAETNLFHAENSIFTDFDGILTYSTSDIFSCRTDGQVESGKYCMATATLREIIKVLGFATSGKRTGSNSVTLIDGRGMVNPYDYILYNTYLDDTQSNYNYATSGTARFGRFDYTTYIHSPSTFNPTLSMNYFKIDENNQETLLLQPELKKEQSILKIGSKLREIFDYIGWQRRDEIVNTGDNYFGTKKRGTLLDPLGGGSNYAGSVINAKLEDEYIWPALKERELLEQKNKEKDSNQKKRLAPLNIRYRGKKLVDPSYRYQYFAKDGIMACLPVDGIDLKDWSLYLIKKDGTLVRVATLWWLEDEIPFNFRQILEGIPNIDDYARTSDGYLRARINCNQYDYSPAWIGNRYDYNWAQHIYIKWFPEKPTISKKDNYLRTLNDPNSYYKYVEVSMAKVGGITEATFTKKEYDGSRVYTTTLNVDPAAGYFTTTIDRELRTTLQLTVSNGRGNRTSDLITYAAESLYNTTFHVSGNNLSVQFLDRYNQPKEDIYATNVKIVDIYNHSINKTNYNQQKSMNNLRQNNSIDISTLPSGVYIVNIIDNNNKSSSYKFIKK